MRFSKFGLVGFLVREQKKISEGGINQGFTVIIIKEKIHEVFPYNENSLPYF